ncbi:hypothetical protein SAMN04488524_0593 [Pedobacter africanus]|uniref:Uncharacterized protein n=2 Tax=Pedobacter africanus TaxID=151894 RepID=A0A1W1ZCK6_9SPHI|nr:hypothetical protein SAMN04488524_0593 [Pedobacter africanus]
MYGLGVVKDDTIMKLTDELWKQFGFKKEPSVGGQPRWYYSGYYFNNESALPTPGSVTAGKLSFPITLDPKNLKNEPSTVKELFDYLANAIYIEGVKNGKNAVKSELKRILDID